MFRRYQGRAMRKLRMVPIDSTKNYLQFSTGVAATTVVNIPLAVAVPPGSIDETDAAKVGNVEEGCEIKSIDCNFRLYGGATQGVGDQYVVIIRKNEGLAALGNPTVGQMSSLGSQTWKSRIFFADQATPGTLGGFPMATPPIIIPKRFRVMHANDKWELIISNGSAIAGGVCGMARYKWYK